MNRRTFLTQMGAAVAIAPLVPSMRAAESPDPNRDSELLAQADARIRQHRKAQGRVTLKTPNGQPLPGAKIHLEQVRHHFLFGCNFFMFDRCGDPAMEAAYRAQFADVFNYGTLGFYWGFYERNPGKPDYAYTDRVLEWTAARSIRAKGHPLVWDHPAGSPRWLPDDDAEIEKLSKRRVTEIVSRFGDRLDIWDVVNEATHLPDKANSTRMAAWALEYGPVPYVTEHLKLARAANPNATLLVNDYRIDPPYLELLRRIRAQGGDKCFDAVGIQSHMHDGPWAASKTWDTCDRYAALNLPLHFTETTVVSGPRLAPGEHWGPTTPELEERQAEQAARFYTILFSHPSVAAITWWDFSDRGAWQRAAAGWVRQNMAPKPVYLRMRELIKKRWWTDETATTDQNGAADFNAFFGSYIAGVELANGRISNHNLEFKTAASNQFELTV